MLAATLPSCGAKSALEIGEPCRPDPSGEVCDGIDNDCDGHVDEDIAPVTCGQNGCETTVRCEGGVMAACVPREPEPEACNLRDDDCDGQVDEGFGFGPVGETVVLRSTELETGSCTSCKWAWGTTIVPTGNGALALWNLSLGGGEQPNLYGRAVDGFGQPTEPIDLLGQDFIRQLHPTPALEPLPPKGLPIAADFRVGGGEAPGILFVSAAGQIETVMDLPGFGPLNVPRTVWSGERFVTAWRSQDDELQVAVLTADGAFERMVEVDPLDRPAAITLGVYPGRVGILVSRYLDDPEQRHSWFIRLDARGEVVTPAHPVDAAYTTWQRLVGVEGGWLHIRPNSYQEPSSRQRLDVDGDPIAEASFFDDQRSLGDSGLQDVFRPRPGLGEMVAAWQSDSGGDMHVEFLDDRGDVLRGWSGPVPPTPGFDEGAFASPHVAFVGASGSERLLVIWHGIADDAEPNLVALRAFGCVP